MRLFCNLFCNSVVLQPLWKIPDFKHSPPSVILVFKSKAGAKFGSATPFRHWREKIEGLSEPEADRVTENIKEKTGKKTGKVGY